MDFFKSLLAEDSDLPELEEESPILKPEDPSVDDRGQNNDDDDDDRNSNGNSDDDLDTNPNSSDDVGGWSFGGIMKTFTTRSESVLETYRRDLKEFGSGLRNETALFREVASRAVRELPASIEAAKSSVGTVGHAIDGVLKSTAEIISQGKDSLLAPSDVESEISGSPNFTNQSFSSGRYSRFDAQLRAIQSDVSTYCEEPEDLDDFGKWRSEFVLEDKGEEIESLIEENRGLEGVYKRVVPASVDHDTFWIRYFYRVRKLKQQEDLRANLVKRAISADNEEELTWDIDDEEDENEESGGLSKGNKVGNKELGSKDSNPNPIISEDSSVDEPQVEKSSIFDAEEMSGGSVIEEKMQPEQASESNKDELVKKHDEEVILDEEADQGESVKDCDVSIVSTQPSMPEVDDLGWDEIEDLGSDDEKKVTKGSSPKIADLKKRLSVTVTDNDEDLNWDIEEDDDEAVKA